MSGRKHWPATGAELLDAVLGPAGAGWTIKNGRMAIDTRPLSRHLHERDTPAYLYSAAAIDASVRAVRAILPAGIDLHYAIKANPFPPLLEHLATQVDGFDCASLEEMQRLQRIDQAGGRLLRHASIAGPAKSDDELTYALEHEVLINAESEQEIQRIIGLQQQRTRNGAIQPARIALRVNPPFELKGSGMRMGGGAKPFGIDSERIAGVIEWLQNDPEAAAVELVGFHLFAGSQCLDAEVLVSSMEQSLSLVSDWQEQTGFQPAHINLGGGFGVPYHPGEAPLDLERLGGGLQQVAARGRAELPTARLVLELGRFLVAGAGIYVTRVVDIKDSRGRRFVLCDGGMHHHLALSGNLGQVLRRNWPLVALDRMTVPATEPLDLAGPLCTPLDVLGSQQPMPPLVVGDLIGVLQSGAYGASASPAGFLSRPPASEWMLD